MAQLTVKGTKCEIPMSGSFTYQYHTCDIFGFAMKATYGEVNGVGRAIFKPKTDSDLKHSARGLLRVIRDEMGEY